MPPTQWRSRQRLTPLLCVLALALALAGSSCGASSAGRRLLAEPPRSRWELEAPLDAADPLAFSQLAAAASSGFRRALAGTTGDCTVPQPANGICLSGSGPLMDSSTTTAADIYWVQVPLNNTASRLDFTIIARSGYCFSEVKSINAFYGSSNTNLFNIVDQPLPITTTCWKDSSPAFLTTVTPTLRIAVHVSAGRCGGTLQTTCPRGTCSGTTGAACGSCSGCPAGGSCCPGACSGYTYNMPAGCRPVATCADTNTTAAGDQPWRCAAPNSVFNTSASSLSPPNATACCQFQPTCGQWRQGGPAWNCSASGLSTIPGSANFSNPTNSSWNTLCCFDPRADSGVVAAGSRTVPANTATNVTFTVTANGPSVSNGTVFRATWPSALSYQSISCQGPTGPVSCGTVSTSGSNSTVACTLGDIAPPTVVTCTLTFRPNTTVNSTITGVISFGPGAIDTNTPNNTAVAWLSAFTADSGVTAAGSRTVPANTATNVTFTVTANGPSVSNGTVFTATWPSALPYQSISCQGPTGPVSCGTVSTSGSNSTVACTLGDIAPPTVVTCTLTFRPNTTVNSTITGVISFGPGAIDTNTPNNTAVAWLSAFTADSGVTAAGSRTVPANTATNVTFTVTANGPSVSNGTVFTATWPSALPYQSISCQGPTGPVSCGTMSTSGSNSTVACTLGDIAPPTVVTCTLTFRPNTTVNSTITGVISFGPGAIDTNTPNNTAVAWLSAFTADSGVTAAGSRTVPANTATNVTFTVTANGPSVSNGTVFKATWPSALPYQSISCQGPTGPVSCGTVSTSGSNSTVACTLGDIAPPTVVTCTLTFRPNTTVNSTITGVISFGPGAIDTNTPNNTAVAWLSAFTADSGVTAAGSRTVPANTATNVTFTVTANGPSVSNGTVFTATWPSALPYQSISCQGPTGPVSCGTMSTSGSNSTVACTLGDIAPPTVVTCTLTFRPNTTVNSTITGVISFGPGAIDTNTPNNTAVAWLSAFTADSGVTAAGSRTVPANTATNVTFTVTANGPSVSNGTVFTATWPSALPYQSISCQGPTGPVSCGTMSTSGSNSTVACTLGDIAPPTVVTCTLTFRPNTTVNSTITGVISFGPGAIDTNTPNNTAVAWLSAFTADSGVTAAGSRTVPPNTATNVTFTVTANGPSVSNGTVFTATWPSALPYQSISCQGPTGPVSCGTVSTSGSNSGVACTLGDIAPPTVVTCTLTFRPNTTVNSTITGVISFGPGAIDTNTPNNTAVAWLSAFTADSGVTAAGSRTVPANTATNVTFTVTANGPSVSNGTVFTATWPSALPYQSISCQGPTGPVSCGTVSTSGSNSGVACTLADIAPPTVVTCTLTFRPNTTVNSTITGVISFGPGAIDTNTPNNTAVAWLSAFTADSGVTAAGSRTVPANTATNVTFTVTANGPSVSNGTVFTATWPSALPYQSIICQGPTGPVSCGTVSTSGSNSGVACTLGDIAPPTVVTCTLTFRLNTTVNSTITGVISFGPGAIDTNTPNNTAVAWLSAFTADSGVTAAGSRTVPANTATNVTFTVTANGPSVSNGTVFTATWPSALPYQSISCQGPTGPVSCGTVSTSGSNSGVACTLGDIAPPTVVTCTLTFRPNTTVNSTITGVISFGPGAIDTNTPNNTAVAWLSAFTADSGVTAAGSRTVPANTATNVTFTVTANGPSVSNGTVFTATWPSALPYQSISCQGPTGPVSCGTMSTSGSNSTVACTLGDIAPPTVVTCTLTFRPNTTVNSTITGVISFGPGAIDTNTPNNTAVAWLSAFTADSGVTAAGSRTVPANTATNVTFTVTANGPSVSNGTVFTATWPSALPYQSISCQGPTGPVSCGTMSTSGSNSGVACTLGDIAPPTVVTCTLTFRLNTTVNSTITGVISFGPGAIDTNTPNNTAVAWLSAFTADSGVTAAGSRTVPPNTATNVTFTVTANGPSVSNGTVFTATWPSALPYQSIICQGPTGPVSCGTVSTSGSNSGVACTLGDIAPPTVVTCTLTFRPNTTVNSTITGVISFGPGAIDTNTPNNTAVAWLSAFTADSGVTAAGSRTVPANTATNVTFTVTANGPSVSNGTVFTATWPSALPYQSISCQGPTGPVSCGTVSTSGSNSGVACTLGDIAPPTVVTCTLTFRPNTTVNSTITGVISFGPGAIDTNTPNNTAVAWLSAFTADSGVTAAGSGTVTVNTATNVTFTVTANGPSVSNGTVFTATWPSALPYQSISCQGPTGPVSCGTMSTSGSNSGVACTLGDIAPPTVVTCTLTFRLNTTVNSTITGVISFGPGAIDTNTPNNTAVAWLSAFTADSGVTAAGSRTVPPNTATNVTFTVTANGPSVSNGTVFTATWPSALPYQSIICQGPTGPVSCGTVSTSGSNSGVACTLGDIAPPTVVTCTLTFRPNTTVNSTITGVISFGPGAIDTNTPNNTAVAWLSAFTADSGVTAAGSRTVPANTATNVTFTVTANGPSVSNGTVFTATWPSALPYQSISCQGPTGPVSCGTVSTSGSNSGVACTLGDIAPPTVVTCTLTFRPNTTVNSTITGVISFGPGAIDTNTPNNTAVAWLSAFTADSGVTAAGSGTVTVNTATNVTFTVTANGPSVSNGTVFTATWPSALPYQSISCQGPTGPVSCGTVSTSGSNSGVACTLGDIAPPTVVTCTLTFRPNTTVNSTITGVISFGPGAIDTNTPNNTAVAWIDAYVIEQADLSADAGVVASPGITVLLGTPQVNATFTVTANGPYVSNGTVMQVDFNNTMLQFIGVVCDDPAFCDDTPSDNGDTTSSLGCSIGDIAPPTQLACVFSFLPLLTGNSSINAALSFSPDASNTVLENDFATTWINAYQPQADSGVTAAGSRTVPANTATNVTFTVTANGPEVSSGTVFTATWPSALPYQSISCQGPTGPVSCGSVSTSGSNSGVACTLGDIAPPTVVTCTLTFRPNTTVNSTITGVISFGPGAIDTNTPNNTAVAWLSAFTADSGVTAAGSCTVPANTAANVTFTVTANGPSVSNGTVFTATWPSALPYQSISCQGPTGPVSCGTVSTSGSNSGVACTLGDIAPPTAVTCTLTFRPNTTVNSTITGVISFGPGAIDTNTPNNTAVAWLSAFTADSGVTAAGSRTVPANTATNVTFTVTANGPSVSNGTVFTATWPSALPYQSISCQGPTGPVSCGSVSTSGSNSGVACTLGDIAPPTVVTCTLTFRPNTTVNSTITGVISFGPGAIDTNTPNNTAVAWLSAFTADSGVTAAGSRTVPANTATNVTFTVTANGPSVSNGTVFTATWPSALPYQSISCQGPTGPVSCGTVSTSGSNSGVACTLGDIAPPTVVTCTLTFRPNTTVNSTITGVISFGPGAIDTNTPNNTAVAWLSAFTADSGVTAAGSGTVTVNTATNVTFTVTANGPSVSNGTVFTATWPSALPYQSIICQGPTGPVSCGSVSTSGSNSGVACTLGDIAPPTVVTCTLTFRPNTTVNSTITGVISFGPGAIDTNTPNNTAVAWIDAYVIEQADLSADAGVVASPGVTVLLGTPQVNATFTVTANGPYVSNGTVMQVDFNNTMLQFIGVVCDDPAFCDDTPSDNGDTTSSLGCSIGDIAPPTQLACVFSFLPLLTGNSSINAALSFSPDASNTVLENDFATTWINAYQPQADSGVTAAGSRTVPANTATNVTFTVTANGPEVSSGTVFTATWPSALPYQSISCQGPTGPVSCGSVSTSGSNSGVACTLGDIAPPTVVTCTLTFRPNTTVNSTITGVISFGPGAIDTNTPNNTAVAWLSAYTPGACPFYMQDLGRGCELLSCEPCAEANPTVYLSIGQNGNPANGLWRIRNFRLDSINAGTVVNSTFALQTPGLAVEFLCVMGNVTQQVGDIAVMGGGEVIVLDVAGNLRYIPADQVPTSATTNYSRVCQTRLLYTFSGSSFTGLSPGFRSDELFISQGTGNVIPVRLFNLVTTVSAGNYTLAGVQVPNDTSPSVALGCSPYSTATNTGGTDITPGPDNQMYRWCAKDANMRYTGTRFGTTLTASGSRVLSRGGASYVTWSMDNAPDQSWANAGAFCTASNVVGTGTFTSQTNPLAGSYASFWSFGFIQGQSQAGITAAEAATVFIPPAFLRSQTVPVVNATGGVIADALRVNGAATRPLCSAPLVA